MYDLIGKYVEIIIEILVLALVMLVVIVFTNMSKTIVNDKRERDAIAQELRQYREVHNYMRADTVKGDDIIRFVGMYRKEYTLEIIKDNYAYRLTKKEANVKKWDIETLKTFIGSTRESDYKVYVEEMAEEDIKVEKIKFILE